MAVITLLQWVYLMLPAYIANMAPVFFKGRLEWLAKPMDFNKEFHGHRLLGENKTWRGLVVGVIAGIVLALIQYLLNLQNLNLVDYSNWLLIGFLLSFGSLLGDAAGSFFKRRFGILPGGKFIPVDQTDYAIGAILFAMIFYPVTWQMAVWLIVLGFVFHVVAARIGFWLKLKDTRW